jgi:integrase
METVSARAVKRKTPKGEPYYLNPQGQAYWQVRAKGSSKDRATLDTFWATREVARERLAKLVADGPLPKSDSNPATSARDVRTVADLINAWKDWQKERNEAGKLADESYTRYQITAAYWITPIGDLSAKRLGRDEVETVVNSWLTGGSAPRTVEFAVRILRMIDPALGFKRDLSGVPDLKGVAPVIREDEFVYCGNTPSPQEFGKVLTKLPSTHRGRALHLQAIVGARVGEIAALKPADYERDTGKLWLSGADEGRGRKGKKARRPFPLPPEGRKLVLEQIARRADDPDGYLFPMGAHPAPSLNGMLADACEKAGVARFSTHGLRRMVVMRMLDAGNNAKTVSKLTGHSLKTLLAHYVRPTPDHLQQAVRRSSLGSFGPAGPQGEGEVIDFPAHTGPEDA